MVHVSREGPVDRTRRSVVEGFLESVTVHTGVAGNPQQPLIGVGVVNDVTRLSADIRPDPRESFLCAVDAMNLSAFTANPSSDKA